MPNQPFRKGFDPTALNRVLLITPRDRRQAAMDALQRTGTRLLINPQAGLMERPRQPELPPPPTDDSPETAAELVEIGVAALLRDVPLSELNQHPDAIRGAATLAAIGAGPSAQLCAAHGVDGLLRLNAARRGDRVGRLILRPVPSGWGDPISFAARRRLGSYGDTAETWAELQRGNVPVPQRLAETSTAITTGRDVASLVDQDPPITLPEYVGRQLLAAKAPPSSRFPARPNEAPFVTGAGPLDIQCAIGEASAPAMRSAWAMKWIHFRRQRPEELWPRACRGELSPVFLQHAGWLAQRLGAYLPMAYAAGSPIHSDDPSGHAVLAGVGFTLLKAWFGDGPVPSLAVETLHPELDAMAWHMAAGRLWAGIHSPSSLRRGLMLGQRYALEHLARQAKDSPQPLGAATFTGFNGVMVSVAGT